MDKQADKMHEKPLPLGNFPNRVLLTGAGWSHNWKGFLAKDFQAHLFDHVGTNDRLRALLLEEPYFEKALEKTYIAPFSADDRICLENAVLTVFRSMDEAMKYKPTIGHDATRINICGVQSMLSRFFGQRNNGIDTGYIFTLNQDIFFERYLNHISGLYPTLPGIQGTPGWQPFSGTDDAFSPDKTVCPITNTSEWKLARLEGWLNIVKLHGSFNWRTSDGQNMLVVGGGKTEKIQGFPLLEWYAETFRRVLNKGNTRLMIVGYSFGDEHINAAIANAIEHHGLKVFIWDIIAPKERCGENILNGLLGWSTQKMLDVFPSNQEETEEYKRIQVHFCKPASGIGEVRST